jgi:phenylacetic acid degradation protein paaN
MDLFEKHRPILKNATDALSARTFWSPFAEIPSPKVYGETAQVQAEIVIAALVGQDYPLHQPGERERVATEHSPYGVPLEIRYPDCEPSLLLTAADLAQDSWQRIGPNARTGVLLEALMRIHKRSHEIAHAVMLTTGQGQMMAFQAGAAHAQDRALESIACAWKAMADVPAEALWVKPQGKRPSLVMKKHFDIVGRGLALVIGCATFPTWNTYPGLFAALATGNPVIVKPHPNAVLPAAITVSVLREVLAEEGLDPNIVTLAISASAEQTRDLATDARVTSIDFTGSSSFGNWLRDNARQARLYAEMAGTNAVIIESTDDYAGMLRNLAFSLCLYSGQMCTTPQNLMVQRTGIDTNEGAKSFDEVGHDLAAAIDSLLADPNVAFTVLGAISSTATLARLDEAALHGRVIRHSQKLNHPEFPNAQVRTPLLLAVDEAEAVLYEQECFGPISYIIATTSAKASVMLAESTIRSYGALTLGLYSTAPQFIDSVIAASQRARVALSINLTQNVFVNQSAGFSDFHATGSNPAANASYTTTAFVADRFVVVQRRQHA